MSNDTFTAGQPESPKPSSGHKWLDRLKWLWARRWGKAVIGVFVATVLIAGFAPAEDETAQRADSDAAAAKRSESPGVEVANLRCGERLCAGSLKIDGTTAEARVTEAARAIQWALAEHDDADRASVIVAGPGAATWVQCTRAQSTRAGDDAQATQDECSAAAPASASTPTSRRAGPSSIVRLNARRPS